MTRCPRCRRFTDVTLMSTFNTDLLCLDCKDREERHPDYEAARKAEAEAARRGVFDFPGVGKPADL